MTIKNTTDRELTDREQRTIKHFKQYTKGENGFVLIADNVVALMKDEHENESFELMKMTASISARYVFFKDRPCIAMIQDDGAGTYTAGYEIYAIAFKDELDNITDNAMPQHIIDKLWGDIENACRNYNPLAYVMLNTCREGY